MIRLGAVGYLNARPLVYGLDREPRFSLRYDVPARCAQLLHGNEIDLGLIPAIEYLRGPRGYGIVPGPAVVSNGPVASVALYTRLEPRDIRSVAMDATSRTSVALTTILLRRAFDASPRSVTMAPDLDAMLDRADAALIIGDLALLVDHERSGARKIDLGELWKQTTGLPFVYAFWAGRPEVLDAPAVELLQKARDLGVKNSGEIAREYFRDSPERQALASEYLRHNIQYVLGSEELEGLRTFYRYAAEAGLAEFDGELRFHYAEHHGAR